jgi:cob(I)alamin adenosyltransferase
VCRRAERLIITLAATATVAPIVTTYINRLSDYLFTLARYVNLLTSTPETPWLPTK